jgi:hypothetical protein
MDLKIVMCTIFVVIMISTVHSFINYNVDEMANVDAEIIQQIIEWDYFKLNFCCW